MAYRSHYLQSNSLAFFTASVIIAGIVTFFVEILWEDLRDELFRQEREREETDEALITAGTNKKISPNHAIYSKRYNATDMKLHETWLFLIGLGNTIVFNMWPNTLLRVLSENKLYYSLNSLAAITGCAFLKKTAIIDIPKTALAGYIIGFGLEPFVPEQLIACWGEREASSFDVLHSIGHLTLVATGVRFFYGKATIWGERLFGSALISISVYYTLPQAGRDFILSIAGTLKKRWT